MTRLILLPVMRCETAHCGRQFVQAAMPTGYYCDRCAEFRRVNTQEKREANKRADWRLDGPNKLTRRSRTVPLAARAEGAT